jgi:2-desacetyl-2-hydroxyethyl bacteriochlorophyllide A dehydrogenase
VSADAQPRRVAKRSRATEPSRQAEPRAAWITAPRRVELRSEERRPLEAGEVRVRALASALSHGTEMLVYRGQAPTGLALDLPTLAGSFALPAKYGYALVGEVIEAGRDANLRPGQRVFVHHPHQTELAVAASFPVPLPDDAEPECAVFLANLETAINIVLDAHPRLGERVVVIGQGVVGLLVTQLLLRSGVRVTAVDGYERRRALAARFGATSQAPGGLPRAEADVTIEVSGNPAALQGAIEATADEGTVVVASWYGSKPVDLQLGERFHRGRLRLVSSQVSRLDPALGPRWDRERRMRLAIELLGELELSPLISHRIPFEEAAEAYRLIDERPEEVVQVILEYDR